MRTFQCDSSVCLCLRPISLCLFKPMCLCEIQCAGRYLVCRVCTFVFVSSFVNVFCLGLCFGFVGTFVFAEIQWSLCWAPPLYGLHICQCEQICLYREAMRSVLDIIQLPINSCICLCEHIYLYKETVNPVSSAPPQFDLRICLSDIWAGLSLYFVYVGVFRQWSLCLARVCAQGVKTMKSVLCCIRSIQRSPSSV